MKNVDNLQVEANFSTFMKTAIWGAVAATVAAVFMWALFGDVGVLLAFPIIPVAYFAVAFLAIVDKKMKLDFAQHARDELANSKGRRIRRSASNMALDEQNSTACGGADHDSDYYYFYDPSNSSSPGNIYHH